MMGSIRGYLGIVLEIGIVMVYNARPSEPGHPIIFG